MTTTPKTRPTSAAEKLAARLRGEEVPDLVAVPTPTAQRHLDRLQARTGPTKPAGMSSAAWHASRVLPSVEDPEDDGPAAA